MSPIEKIASLNLTRNKDGRLIFYPWGLLGNGYYLDASKQEEDIRRVLIRITYISAFYMLFCIFIPWTGICGVLFAGYILYYEISIRAFVKNALVVPDTIGRTLWIVFLEVIIIVCLCFSLGGAIYYGVLVGESVYEIAEFLIMTALLSWPAFCLGKKIYCSLVKSRKSD